MHRSSLALILLIWGCGGASPVDGDGSGAGGTGGMAGGGAGGSAGVTEDPDPDPQLSDDEWARLQELAPAELPAPPEDPTNAWADDPAAAELGQVLFFDPRFSGSLLDGDNDGTQFALGMKGDTGKVSCAGCHVPEMGFSDTRTIRQQISLGSDMDAGIENILRLTQQIVVKVGE